MIYFIGTEDESILKIGFAVDPKKRLGELQVGCPHALKIVAQTQGDRADEATLHRKFARAKIRGEWFRSTEQMRRLVARIRAGASLVLALSFDRRPRSGFSMRVDDAPDRGSESVRWAHDNDNGQWERRQDGLFAPW